MKDIAGTINRMAMADEPFLFVISYSGQEAYIKPLSGIDPGECLYDFNGRTNQHEADDEPVPQDIIWETEMPKREDYQKSFGIVRNNILAGNSYLANLTCQAAVRCNLSPRQVFAATNGKYRLCLHMPGEEKSLVCFSPETFVQITDGRISSFPMKGTIDASLPEAWNRLMNDAKERAEHATIVDLIRNDLSQVAHDVRVSRYRYTTTLHTNRGDIIQTSSQVTGTLPTDYRQHLGDILLSQLPAGSITGAPKAKTVSIINEAEGYQRGFYTGIMGICDHGQVDSAVMIRFMEEGSRPCTQCAGSGQKGLHQYTFKAGGGITSQSQCQREYEEVMQKIYLPINSKLKP